MERITFYTIVFLYISMSDIHAFDVPRNQRVPANTVRRNAQDLNIDREALYSDSETRDPEFSQEDQEQFLVPRRPERRRNRRRAQSEELHVSRTEFNQFKDESRRQIQSLMQENNRLNERVRALEEESL